MSTAASDIVQLFQQRDAGPREVHSGARNRFASALNLRMINRTQNLSFDKGEPLKIGSFSLLVIRVAS